MITLGAKKVTEQFQAATALANTFVVNSDQTVATSALARLKFVENSLKAISTTNEKILRRHQGSLRHAGGIPQALAKLVDNAKEIDELIQRDDARRPPRSYKALGGDEVGPARRSAAARRASRMPTIGETERLIVMLAAGGFLLGCVWAFLLGKGISRPMTRCASAMRELAAGNFDVVLPGLGRKDELGEMAGAVEEFKVQAVAQGRARRRGPGCAEQGEQRRAPHRTDSLCR